jgi:hypothetical protein
MDSGTVVSIIISILVPLVTLGIRHTLIVGHEKRTAARTAITEALDVVLRTPFIAFEYEENHR